MLIGKTWVLGCRKYLKGKLSSNVVHSTCHPLVSSYQVLRPLPGAEAWPLSPLLRLWNVRHPFLPNPFIWRWREAIRYCHVMSWRHYSKDQSVQRFSKGNEPIAASVHVKESCKKSLPNMKQMPLKWYRNLVLLLRCVLKMDHHCPW